VISELFHGKARVVERDEAQEQYSRVREQRARGEKKTDGQESNIEGAVCSSWPRSLRMDQRASAAIGVVSFPAIIPDDKDAGHVDKGRGSFTSHPTRSWQLEPNRCSPQSSPPSCVHNDYQIITVSPQLAQAGYDHLTTRSPSFDTQMRT
jgi:hypothetical protein